MLTATSPLFLSLSSRTVSLLRLSVVREQWIRRFGDAMRCDALSDDTAEVSGVPKVNRENRVAVLLPRGSPRSRCAIGGSTSYATYLISISDKKDVTSFQSEKGVSPILF